MFAYCNNNPIRYTDPSGKRATGPSYMLMCDGGTAASVASADQDPELEKETSYLGVSSDNILAVTMAAGAMAVGAELEIKLSINLTSGLIGILGTYNELRRIASGTGLEVHHLIEKRFFAVPEIARIFQTQGQMPCVILDRDQHQGYTNAWRGEFPYGKGYSGISTSDIMSFCRNEYGPIAGGHWIEFLEEFFM